MTTVKANLIDLHLRQIYAAEVQYEEGVIKSIIPIDEEVHHYLLPGFIDAHIHIESSMVVPYEFSRIALGHGTVATVSDPHEIANVLGLKGVEYMLDNAKDAKLKFHFGAPSCVPATSFETSGSVIDSNDIDDLMKRDDIHYLSEMMNYPGVLSDDQEVLEKLRIAKKYGKPIDGHAPGLRGKDVQKYIKAGITTDHECSGLEEAMEKIDYGMKILIREGSAAKNYNALHPLIDSHPSKLMFCSDDKHPDDLMEGHINQMVLRSLRKGYDLFDVLRIACVHPVEHYHMDVGLLREGDRADFIMIEDLQSLKVLKTVIDGNLVYSEGVVKLPNKQHVTPNQFFDKEITIEEFVVFSDSEKTSVICAIDGELITERSELELRLENGILHNDVERDLLKISVINRYQKAPIASAFIKGFGLREGAIASTVAHDSHNLIVVGTEDKLMLRAARLVMRDKGGLSAVTHKESMTLPLPVAGLMSNLSCEEVANSYSAIDRFVKSMGSKLKAPFMTLSFMALLVIPSIKISDKGLFDTELFRFINKV